jgi:hypothetical protein
MTTPLLGTTGVTMDSPDGSELFAREEKSELFIAAVSTLGGDSAYETAAARTDRIRGLTRSVALADPAWIMRFSRWLRDEANIRTMSTTIAAEFLKSRLDAKVPDETTSRVPGMNRVAINVSCMRADEPSKIVEYWHDNYGRQLPMPLKRGLADACQRLYNERSALKYDTDALKIRFGDVIELVHPSPRDPAQGALFEWLLDRRHGHKDSSTVLGSLPVVTANTHVRNLSDSEASRALVREQLLDDPTQLADAGLTWENLSGFGKMDARAWEAVIPRMGYMALLRNLRNFDGAGISEASVKAVQAKLADPAEVTRSRQLPFRFYSAYSNSDARWHQTLETALELSTKNIKPLPGRTLCLVDCSGSMWGTMGKSNALRWEMAALFGTVLKFTNPDGTLLARYGSDYHRKHPGYETVKPRRSVLGTIKHEYPDMGGTATGNAVAAYLKSDGPFDRVIIITDEQETWGARGVSVEDATPATQMLYTWNVAGYAAAHVTASPYRHTFAGLTDQGFAMIPAIESGMAYDWPF